MSARRMLSCLAIAAIASLTRGVVAQAPQPALDFANAWFAMALPEKDDPDAVAAAGLRSVDGIRGTAFAHHLVRQVYDLVGVLQRPADLLPAIERLLAQRDLHGALRDQLQWLRFRLLRASGRIAEAVAADPVAALPKSWLCVGPFGDGGDHHANVPYPPELSPWTASSEFAGFEGSVRPRVVQRGIGSAMVEPNDPARGSGCYYSLLRVEAAVPVQGLLQLWSAGGLQVFVNGAAIAYIEASFGDGRADFVVPVALAQGVNHVLVKSCTNGDAAFELVFADARGAPLPGLQWIAADAPMTACAAAVPATEPVPPTGVDALLAAAQSVEGDQRVTLQLAAGLVACVRGPHDLPLQLVDELAPPADPARRLLLGQLVRGARRMPEELRNRRARALEEAAFRGLPDEHWGVLSAHVGLLEEQDQRERALRLLWAAVDAGRAGPQTFELLLGVAQRARFWAERAVILQRWRHALPNDPRPLHELARDLSRRGATAHARDAAVAGLRLRPDLAESLGFVFWLCCDLQDLQTAEQLLELTMPTDLLDTSMGHTRRLWDASAAERSDDAARWLQLLDELQRSGDCDAGRLRSFANDLLAQGHTEQAVQMYRRSLERDADAVEVRQTLQRLDAAPRLGGDLERFRHDGDAAIAAFTATEREANAPATLLIDQQLVEVFADGSSLVEMHRLRRINDPSGVEEYKTASDAAAADELLALRTVTVDGTSYIPTRVDKTFAMPRLAPGVFIEERYRDFVAAEPDGRPRVPEFLLGSFDENVLLAELVVVVPAGVVLDLRERNDPGEPESIDLDGGRRALRWRRSDVLRLLPDRNMPALGELVPVVGAGVDVSVFAELRSDAHRIEQTTWPTPPVAASAAELLVGIDEAAAQFAALHTFCHGEIEAARSRSVTETLLNRKGDRQELLMALARAAGFELEVARCESVRADLVGSTGSLFRDGEYLYDMPCARLRKDGVVRWVFLDVPRHAPADRMPPERAGAGAVLLSANGLQLLRLPSTDERMQGFEIDGVGKLDGERLELQVTARMGGDSGYGAAEHFQRQPVNQQRQFARQFLSSLFPQWQVQSAELVPFVAGERLAVRGTVRSRAVQSDGDREHLPIPLPPSKLLGALGDRPGRSTPMRLTTDLGLTTRLRIDLGDRAVTALPTPTMLQRQCLDYLQDVRLEDGALIVERRLQVRPGTIPPGLLPDWMRWLQEVERAEQSRLELRTR